MDTATLPIESHYVLHKDGTYDLVSETCITVPVGQAYVEAMLALKGCTPDDLAAFIAEEDKKAAEQRRKEAGEKKGGVVSVD